jgi:hypothetical protein
VDLNWSIYHEHILCIIITITIPDIHRPVFYDCILSPKRFVLNKKTGRLIISRNVMVILLYRSHKTIDLIYFAKHMQVTYFEHFSPYTLVSTLMCLQRSVRLSPPAASVDRFVRRRNRAVFRVLQAGCSSMPGAGGRLRLPSLGTESTTSNSSSQGSGGVSQLQKERHRVVVMG